jgi:hypothetical protein
VSFSAVVVDIVDEGRSSGRQRWQVLLDRTEFCEGDRGTLEAVARSGARLTVPIVGVVIRDGELWHQVEKPLPLETAVTGVVVRSGAGSHVG